MYYSTLSNGINETASHGLDHTLYKSISSSVYKNCCCRYVHCILLKIWAHILRALRYANSSGGVSTVSSASQYCQLSSS